MCGIAGYAGNLPAKDFLLEALEKLEYRGYDSAGIATLEADSINISKTKGKLNELTKKVASFTHNGTIGIGHTRWATHGKPDEINSHPHISQDRNFAVVHNGIIENYLSLKKMLEEHGFKFKSETDTEVIPNLIQHFYKGNVFDAFIKATSYLKGSYALGLVSCFEPDKIYAVAKDSPLIVGKGNQENYLASDIPALLQKTKNVYMIKDNEFAIITKDSITFFDSEKNQINKEITKTDYTNASVSKNGYEFFMLKEIMEQPDAVKNTITPRIKDGYVNLSEISLTKEYFSKLNKIFIVACGSAYHAGLIGKNIIENMARVFVSVELASEFRYSNPVIEKGDLVIVISQSGETSDSLAALKYAKSKGAEIISIVNVKESSIARESKNVIYTNAGPEIAVATTKAYLTQIVVLFLLAVHISDAKNRLTDVEHKAFVNQLTKLPEMIKNTLCDAEKINELSKEFLKCDNVFFIGRGLDSYIAMEGSLKLKEISYIHSQSYAAGELKHGTISLVEEGTLVVALCTDKKLYEKMLGNIKEVKARGATVIAVITRQMTEIEQVSDKTIKLPDLGSFFSGVLAVIYLQLFAYYVSYNKGLDVDKPRNLAKSVTVE